MQIIRIPNARGPQEEQRHALVGIKKADPAGDIGGSATFATSENVGGGGGGGLREEDSALVDVIRTGNDDLAAEAELCASVLNTGATAEPSAAACG